MPLNIMGRTIQAVVIGGDVYVGGGGGENEDTVMVYSLQTGTWRTLPPYESRYFGMAVVNNQLVLVGGQRKSILAEVTNVLGLWDERSQSMDTPLSCDANCTRFTISRLLPKMASHCWRLWMEELYVQTKLSS